jgi:hypothetical protein
MTSSNRRDVVTGLILGTGTLLGAHVADAAELDAESWTWYRRH